MHKISGFALPAALILAGVGGLGWVAATTHPRVEPRPSAAGSALEHQLHCALPMLPLGAGVWRHQHLNCRASATVANVGPGGWRTE